MSYLKASDIAHELGISRSAAYEIMKEMPRLVHRGIVRVSSEAFKRWVDQNTVSPATVDAQRLGRAVHLATRQERRRQPLAKPRTEELRIRLIQPRTVPRSPDLVRPSMRGKGVER